MPNYRVISSDNHVFEAPDLWTSRAKPAFKDRVPQLVREYDGDWWYCDGHVWTTASVQGKNGRSATWSGAVMCPASTDAVRMTAGHDEFHGSGPNHLAAHFVPWPSRVFPIPA